MIRSITLYFKCQQCGVYEPIEHRAKRYCSRKCRAKRYYKDVAQARYKASYIYKGNTLLYEHRGTIYKDSPHTPPPLIENQDRQDTGTGAGLSKSPLPPPLLHFSKGHSTIPKDKNIFFCEHFELKGECLWKGCVNE